MTGNALVCAASASRLEFACQENQWCPDQARAAQQPEAVQKAKERRLLLDDSR
jgi:hypothetical protein